MKKYRQLGLAVTMIILIIAVTLAIATLTYALIQKVNHKNTNEKITFTNIIQQFKEDWRPVLKASAFTADPLEQYSYNLPVEKETNTNTVVNENTNENPATADWLNYSNTVLGLSFKYPAQWGEVKVKINEKGMNVNETGSEVMAGKGIKITLSEYQNIWLVIASSDFNQFKRTSYNGGEDLTKKCEKEGELNEDNTAICQNTTMAGQATYENIVAEGDECTYVDFKEIRLNTKIKDYPGLYLALSLPSTQQCNASEENNKAARKTDLENQFNRVNLSQGTTEDLLNFDLFLDTLQLLEEENTNVNVNANVNANINENANLNENLNVNENINVNLNENANLNLNLNANTNENENINANLNENLNTNADLNQNLNINENVNTNANQNNNINASQNTNLNENINLNTNTNIEEKPAPTAEEEWYKSVKNGTLVFQANWYCSAAGMAVYTEEPDTTGTYLGRYHGDCTNPSVQVKGNFKPIILGEYKKGEKISFRLESDLHREYATVHTKVKDECYIDYFPFSGRKDVPAIQFTCDDGYKMGLWDDIQFTVYVFPKGTKIDIPDVINVAEVDSDGDGLTDQQETKLGTNPIQFDTDGDGYSDKTEVDTKNDPLKPAATPNSTPETFEKKYYSSPPLNINQPTYKIEDL